MEPSPTPFLLSAKGRPSIPAPRMVLAKLMKEDMNEAVRASPSRFTLPSVSRGKRKIEKKAQK